MSKAIALLIDHSGSMGPGGYGYLEYAKTDAATFVNIMHQGDNCAVVEFSDNADVVQPLTVLSSQSVTDAICRKILAIVSANLTNIGDAIVKAKDQLGGAQGSKAMVLLTDGEWNQPPDPLTVLPSYPIYTIALGNSSAINTMKEIAQRTGGTYHFAPGYRELQRVYNEIAQDSSIADTITNDLESVNAYGYREITTTFSPGVDEGKLALSWDNTDIAYTSGTPTGNQVNVSITDPSGQAYTNPPVFIGPAGVVFSIPNPAPGVWIVGCWYAGQAGGRPLGCVWGGFEPNGTAALKLKTADATRTVGKPSGIDIDFSDAGGPIASASIRAILESPAMTFANAAKNNAGVLETIAVSADDGEKTDKDIAKAAAFERQTGRSFIPASQVPLRVIARENGTHHVDIPKADIAGQAALRIVAEGISKKTGTLVKRTRYLTITAE